VRFSDFKQGNQPSETKTKSSDKMKTRTLFQTAIEYVMDAKNHSVHSEAMEKEYSNYLYFHKSGDTASWETARKAIWEMLIDSGALEKSFQNAKLAAPTVKLSGFTGFKSSRAAKAHARHVCGAAI